MTGQQQSGSAVPPPQQPAPVAAPVASNKEERTWAMFAHLAAFAGYIGVPFGNIIGPLIIWQVKKDTMPMVAAHGKESLNFQISVTIYAIPCIVLTFFCIGFFLLAALGIFAVIVVIMAAIKANNGEPCRYPLSIRFIKQEPVAMAGAVSGASVSPARPAIGRAGGSPDPTTRGLPG